MSRPAASARFRRSLAFSKSHSLKIRIYWIFLILCTLEVSSPLRGRVLMKENPRPLIALFSHQICLWTACLLAASASSSDHQYLSRETVGRFLTLILAMRTLLTLQQRALMQGNLKLAGKRNTTFKFLLPPRPLFELYLRQEHQQVERQQLYCASNLPELLSDSRLSSLRLFEGLLTGLPAPFTGISAIS